MATIKEIYEKAIKVIDTCESKKQAESVQKYVDLSIKKMNLMGCKSMDFSINKNLIILINDLCFDLQKRLKNLLDFYQ